MVRFPPKRGNGEGAYCSSVVSIELVILIQGFNWYNHGRSQPWMSRYGMMTPQVVRSGTAIAELNNIPIYKKSIVAQMRERETKKSYLNRRSDRTEELCKCDTEKFRKYDHEQLEPCSVESCGSTSKPDRINHQDPVHDGADDRVGDLRQDLRDGEDFGRVESTVRFSNECGCPRGFSM